MINKGFEKILLSPLNGVKKLIDDVSGDNEEYEQGLSILTLGVSSIVGGMVSKISEGIGELFEDED